MEPMEMKALNPSWIERLQSRIAVQSAPLWLMKPMLPGSAKRPRERRVQADVRQHHAYAVRPDDPHLSASLENLLFEFGPGRSTFLESSRDDDGTFHTRGCTFGDDSRNCCCRRGDHSKIDISWHILDRRKRLLSEDHLVTRIHWKNVTVKSVADFPVALVPRCQAFRSRRSPPPISA